MAKGRSQGDVAVADPRQLHQAKGTRGKTGKGVQGRGRPGGEVGETPGADINIGRYTLSPQFFFLLIQA